MDTLHELAGKVYYGNDLQSWAEALGIFLLLVVLPFVRLALDRRLRTLQPHQSPSDTLRAIPALIEQLRGQRSGFASPGAPIFAQQPPAEGQARMRRPVFQARRLRVYGTAVR